jgi:hypothetical protein
LANATATTLARDKGCLRMPSLVLSSAMRGVIRSIDKARSCLTGRRLRVVGGPVLPPQGDPSPDGELIVGTAHGAFIAFYLNSAKATRLAPGIEHNAARTGGQVERRGAVTILWVAPPRTSAAQQ